MLNYYDLILDADKSWLSYSKIKNWLETPTKIWLQTQYALTMVSWLDDLVTRVRLVCVQRKSYEALSVSKYYVELF